MKKFLKLYIGLVDRINGVIGAICAVLTIFMVPGYTLREDGHVRIDLIYGTKSPKFKAVINLLGSCLFAIPFLWFLWKWSLPLVVRSFAILEKSSEAGGLQGVFVLKGAILVFCITLALQVSALMIRSLLTLFTDENYLSETAEGSKHASDPLVIKSEA